MSTLGSRLSASAAFSAETVRPLKSPSLASRCSMGTSLTWTCPDRVDGLALSVTSCRVYLDDPLWELWETCGARFSSRPRLFSESPAPRGGGHCRAEAGATRHARRSSGRWPSSRSAWRTQLRIAWAVGSNSSPSDSGVRPARTKSTIRRRNPAAYGRCKRGTVTPPSPTLGSGVHETGATPDKCIHYSTASQPLVMCCRWLFGTPFIPNKSSGG